MSLSEHSLATVPSRKGKIRKDTLGFDEGSVVDSRRIYHFVRLITVPLPSPHVLPSRVSTRERWAPVSHLRTDAHDLTLYESCRGGAVAPVTPF